MAKLTPSDNTQVLNQDSSKACIQALLQESYAYSQKEDWLNAKKTLLNASQLDAQNDLIWSNLGVIAKKEKNYSEAIEYYNKALKINANNANLLSNIGSLLIQLKDFKQALKFLEKALSIDENLASIWNNIGSCYFYYGQYEHAQPNYEKALQLDPTNATTAFNLSWCLLRIGEFQRGFTLYEQRFHKNDQPARIRHIHSPRWHKQSLMDQPEAKLCITAEQGFGDTIQFIRLIPQLLKLELVKAEQLIVHIQPECQQLIQQSFPELTIINYQQQEPKECLYHLPLMSLPLVCQLNPLNIPNQIYLSVPKDKKAQWQKHLSLPNNTLAVGIIWQGSPTNTVDAYRSIDLGQFMSIFADCPEPLTLVYLGVLDHQRQQLTDFFQNKSNPYPSISLAQPKQAIKNFADTAAIIQNLDLVITVDTAIAHLSGALGKDTLTLIPYAHDWRWFKTITHSPWYPTMRLIRQQKWNDWHSALPNVKKILHQWLHLSKKL